MNSNTKNALQEFINAVVLLTSSVSSVCGTIAADSVFKTAEKLQDALAKDETILDVK